MQTFHHSHSSEWFWQDWFTWRDKWRHKNYGKSFRIFKINPWFSAKEMDWNNRKDTRRLCKGFWFNFEQWKYSLCGSEYLPIRYDPKLPKQAVAWCVEVVYETRTLSTGHRPTDTSQLVHARPRTHLYSEPMCHMYVILSRAWPFTLDPMCIATTQLFLYPILKENECNFFGTLVLKSAPWLIYLQKLFLRDIMSWALIPLWKLKLWY